MTPCGCDEEGALRALLATYVGKAAVRQRRIGLGAGLAVRRGGHGRQGLGTQQMGEHRRQVGRCADVEPAREGGFGAVVPGDDELRTAGIAGGDRQCERTPNRPQPPVERELADEGAPVQRLGLDRRLRGEDADGDREIERGAPFPQTRRREVHRDAAVREAVSRRLDRRAHPGRALADGRLGQPDDVDTRQL